MHIVIVVTEPDDQLMGKATIQGRQLMQRLKYMYFPRTLTWFSHCQAFDFLEIETNIEFLFLKNHLEYLLGLVN